MNKLIKTGILSYIPETPAKEGRPAFCQVEYKLHQKYVLENGVLQIKSEYLPETVCYPEIPPTPAIPAQDSTKPMTGWNAGAVSVVSFADNCQLTFNIPQNFVGIICGLSNGQPIRSYYHVAHGFLFKVNEINGSLESFIIESGVIKQQLTVELMYRPRFRVRALAGDIYYYAENYGQFELVGTSKNTITGNLFAESTLYMVNDFVNNPEFISIDNQLALSIIPLVGGFSNYTTNLLNAVMPILQGSFETGNYLYGQINIAANFYEQSFSGFLSAISLTTIPFEGDTAPNIQSGSMVAVMPPLYLTPMLAINGGVGELAVNALSLKSLLMSDREYYGELAISSLPPLKGFFTSSQEASDQVTIQEFLLLEDKPELESAVLIIFAESLTVNDNIDIGLIVNITGDESLIIDETISFSGVLELIIQEKIRLISKATSKDTKNYQYAVNTANYALSLYDNFDFIGFANCNGASYAIKPDGLYRLSGTSDNGQLINAEIDIGAKDWGIPQIKRVSSAYLGIRSDGDIYLKVIVDDKHTNVYRLEDNENQRRTFMAKGAAGRYWRMKLILEDLSYAEIDSLEFEVGVSQRRIRR